MIIVTAVILVKMLRCSDGVCWLRRQTVTCLLWMLTGQMSAGVHCVCSDTVSLVIDPSRTAGLLACVAAVLLVYVDNSLIYQ